MRIPAAIAAMLLLLLLIISGGAMAADAGNVATDITADSLEYDANRRQVRFSGQVHVTRLDFELWADSITVNLEQNGESAAAQEETDMSAGRIESIVAEKNVRVRQDARSGACAKATYTMADGKVLMEGNPYLIDGNDNRIAGEQIVFHTRDGRSEVLGQVRASFTTPEDALNPLNPANGSARNGSGNGSAQETANP